MMTRHIGAFGMGTHYKNPVTREMFVDGAIKFYRAVTCDARVYVDSPFIDTDGKSRNINMASKLGITSGIGMFGADQLITR